jgi:hypothetical protein
MSGYYEGWAMRERMIERAKAKASRPASKSSRSKSGKWKCRQCGEMNPGNRRMCQCVDEVTQDSVFRDMYSL